MILRDLTVKKFMTIILIFTAFNKKNEGAKDSGAEKPGNNI